MMMIISQYEYRIWNMNIREYQYMNMHQYEYRDISYTYYISVRAVFNFDFIFEFNIVCYQVRKFKLHHDH